MFSASIRKSLACAVILAALPTAAGAITLQSVTTIHYPNSMFTLVKGVNDYGELVGEYWTPLAGGKHATHAFYYEGSTYHNIDRINGNLNEAWGINNAGLITAGGIFGGSYSGYYGVPNNYTNYTVPGATFSELFDVNDNNVMVGGHNASGTYRPFIYDLGHDAYTDINVPWGNRSAAVGINNNNQVVGSYWDTSDFIQHGYLFDGTGYTQIDYPSATSTEAMGINDFGQVVGYYVNASSETHGYLYDVYSEEFTTIDIPLVDGNGTRIYDISNNGMLVGGYYDASGVHHGFIATLVPLPPAVLLFGTGLAGLFGMTGIRKGRARQA